MESNCDADTLQSICLEKWGLSNCHRSVSFTLELARRRLRMKKLTTLKLLTGTKHFLVMEPALSTQQTLLATLDMGSICCH